RQSLANGIATGGTVGSIGPMEHIAVRQGDLIALSVGPRDGNHACDLTDVELTLTVAGDTVRTWNLSRDVADDILAGNPHADQFGNPSVWHFFTELDKAGSGGRTIPAGSLLARWQSAPRPDERNALALEVERLLVGQPPSDSKSPDVALYAQL